MTFERGKNDARTRSELHDKSIFTAAGFVVNEHDDASNLQSAHRVLATKQSMLHSLPQDLFFFHEV